MVIDPEGTPEQKKARGTHWIGKTFEEVVEADLKDLERYGITEDTTHEEFRDKYLATRPQGYGSHSLLARGLYALQVRGRGKKRDACHGGQSDTCFLTSDPILSYIAGAMA